MQESREHIKTRMLRTASRVWGYSETESENNFDPLVSMLLTACASELEKISGEVAWVKGEGIIQIGATAVARCIDRVDAGSRGSQRHACG